MINARFVHVHVGMMAVRAMIVMWPVLAWKPATGTRAHAHLSACPMCPWRHLNCPVHMQLTLAQIGKQDVIRGIEQGTLDMCVGEMRTLIIPPSLGYGDEPSMMTRVPPNATLKFIVALLDIQDGPAQEQDEFLVSSQPAACVGARCRWRWLRWLCDGARVSGPHVPWGCAPTQDMCVCATRGQRPASPSAAAMPIHACLRTTQCYKGAPCGWRTGLNANAVSAEACVTWHDFGGHYCALHAHGHHCWSIVDCAQRSFTRLGLGTPELRPGQGTPVWPVAARNLAHLRTRICRRALARCATHLPGHGPCMTTCDHATSSPSSLAFSALSVCPPLPPSLPLPLSLACSSTFPTSHHTKFARTQTLLRTHHGDAWRVP